MNVSKQERNAETARDSAVSLQREKEKKTAALLASVAKGLLWAALGYLSGLLTLPFGATPFGIALLSAAERQAPFVFIGVFLSARHFPTPLLRLSAYSLLILLRLIACVIALPRRKKKDAEKRTVASLLPSLVFRESLGLRILCGTLCSLFLGLMLLLRRDFLFYDLYGLLLTVATTPAALLLYFGAISREGDSKRHSTWQTVGALALSATAVYAAKPLSLLGVSLSPAIALFLSLAAVKRYGLAKGVPAAALLGLAVSPSLCPLFALSALGAAVLMPLSVSLASAVAFCIGVAYGYSIRGLGILNGLFPALLTACLLFSVTDKLFLHIGESSEELTETEKETAKPQATAEACRPLTEAELSGLRYRETVRILHRLRQALSEASDRLEDCRREEAFGTEREWDPLCESAFSCCCTSCSQHALCFGEKRQETEGEILRLSGLLYQKGSVEQGEVSESLRGRCAHLPDILDEMNHHAALCLRAAEQHRKAELFSEEYRGFSHLMEGLLAHTDRDLLPDPALSPALSCALGEIDGITGAAVVGSGRRTVCLQGALSDPKPLLPAILAACAKALPFSLDPAGLSLRTLSEELPLYELSIPEADRISIRYACRTASADGEGALCGDTVDTFCGCDGLFYACISDGMGSGREASRVSTLSVGLLRDLLGGSREINGALSLLNSLLRHRGNGSLHECSSTVDLLELDPARGHARFYKCGAAPTYILREGSLVKLRSNTLPIGIMKQIDPGSIPCEVTAGDVIVMVSDGVTQGKEECPWLFDLLQTRISSSDAEQLANLVLNEAKRRGSADDISVLVMKISSAA